MPPASACLLSAADPAGTSWKVLERADRTPGTNPEDTPFAEMMQKILVAGAGRSASPAGLLRQLRAADLGLTKLVKATDIGFLIGADADPDVLRQPVARSAAEDEKPGLRALLPVYLAGGTFFMVLHLNGSAMTTWANDSTARHLGLNDPVVLIADAVTVKGKPVFAGEAYPGYYGNAARPRSARHGNGSAGTRREARRRRRYPIASYGTCCTSSTARCNRIAAKKPRPRSMPCSAKRPIIA